MVNMYFDIRNADTDSRSIAYSKMGFDERENTKLGSFFVLDNNRVCLEMTRLYSHTYLDRPCRHGTDVMSNFKLKKGRFMNGKEPTILVTIWLVSSYEWLESRM